MKKEIIQEYINNGLSLNKIAKKTKKSLSTILYWTKKYNLKSKFKSFVNKEKKEYGEFRFCPRCKKEVATENFYSRRGKKNASVYCKSCTNEQTLERQRKFKIKCVDYKGRECKFCGYKKSIAALEFHHTNPSEKDFNISHAKCTTFNEIVKKELDKCILLCACCHREEHEKLGLRGIEPLITA
jgi:transposase